VNGLMTVSEGSQLVMTKGTLSVINIVNYGLVFIGEAATYIRTGTLTQRGATVDNRPGNSYDTFGRRDDTTNAMAKAVSAYAAATNAAAAAADNAYYIGVISSTLTYKQPKLNVSEETDGAGAPGSPDIAITDNTYFKWSGPLSSLRLRGYPLTFNETVVDFVAGAGFALTSDITAWIGPDQDPLGPGKAVSGTRYIISIRNGVAVLGAVGN